MKVKTKTKRKESRSTNDEHVVQAAESRLSHYVVLIIGIGIAVHIGVRYAKYSNQLHENRLWFSNIKEVEREISFRTEAGLYYSYYKQMVLAPSISEGLRQLIYDNKTEHLRTINIIERFNIYQEILLAIVYKSLPASWQKSIEPVYLYIDAVLGLHGVFVVAMFVGAWLMSGTFVAGILANAFYIFNKGDMTRLSYTIPLRESFSLPFIFLQITLLTYYFRKDTSNLHKRICLFSIAICTLCFGITWQFAQFVMLLQSFALFGVYSLKFTTAKMVKDIYLIFVGSIVVMFILQFGNDMLFTSLALSFSIAAIIVLSIKAQDIESDGFFKNLGLMVVRIVFVFVLAFSINFGIKKMTQVDSDEHVFKFVMVKLGLASNVKTDFDASLYLCNGAFQNLPMKTFERLTRGIVFPVFAGCMVLFLLLLAFSYWRKLSSAPSILDDHPDLVFNVILNVFFGIMALTTLRMKYLWLPHMAVVAAGLFAHQRTWNACLKSLNINDVLNLLLRNSAPFILIAMLLNERLAEFQKELEQLSEFHDPDTVDLMVWIKSSTPPDAAFTGTMQLLAGVKLCTDRPITNHPHYENKWLRERTKQVYQIYAKRKPKGVYDILKKHGTSYIILENSQCFSRKEKGCTLTDILDTDNELHGIVENVQRFCLAIKNGRGDYTKYFKKVFENKTFYLYQLL